ncbi:hypothetical protein HHK36_021734 [Tetracentron sinense]|uniref:Uncharacterized protein n=1 Tax=Tetracentron sinense TaxID=13715 RepID=A0A834YTM6_TETSI|nr:hypothetical protein HHK36_021734 [Tetracentron sinense]
MSVKEAPALSGTGDQKGDVNAKRRRVDRHFSCVEITIEAGSLKDLDSDKLKLDIKVWARAVVTYARQRVSADYLIHHLNRRDNVPLKEGNA